VSRYVWWTPAARRAVEALTPSERERFDHIADYLAFSPYPEPNSTNVHRSRLFGEEKFIFFNNDFPYMVYYRAADDEVYIELVLKAFVS
jgi:hypothetical protein